MGIDENSPCIRDWGQSAAEPELSEVFAELDWIPAQRVHLRPGIIVRVQKDAYPTHPDLAEIHAGRVGVILEIKDGDVIVKSTDLRSPTLEATHYSPWILEMLLDDCLATSSN